MQTGYDWSWSWLSEYRPAILHALWQTIALNAIAIGASWLVGATLCALRRLSPPPVSYVWAALISVLRAIPLLVLMIWLFFCLPLLSHQYLGVWGRLSPWWAAVIAIAANMGAYVAEILRAGLDSVPPRLVQSGYLSGLSRLRVFRHITVPYAARAVIPPLTNQSVSTIKLSAVSAFIAVPELLYTGQSIIRDTLRTLEVYTGIAIGYLIIILPLSLLSDWIERRFASAGAS